MKTEVWFVGKTDDRYFSEVIGMYENRLNGSARRLIFTIGGAFGFSKDLYNSSDTMMFVKNDLDASIGSSYFYGAILPRYDHHPK